MLMRLIHNPSFSQFYFSHMLFIIFKCLQIIQQIPPKVFGKFTTGSILKITLSVLSILCDCNALNYGSNIE
eukprot:UN07788